MENEKTLRTTHEVGQHHHTGKIHYRNTSVFHENWFKNIALHLKHEAG